MEFDHWKEMTNSGFTLLNQFYLLIRSNGDADKEMQEQIAKLYKLCHGRQKVVKFLEDEAAADKDNNDLSFGTMNSITDSPVKHLVPFEAPSTGKKRPNSDSGARVQANKMPKIGSNSKKVPPVSTFNKPKAVKSINFNAKQEGKSVFKVPTVAPILKQTINADQLNSTFDIAQPALSENAINVKTDAKWGKMEAQSKKKLIDRAAITLNKENKKFTPRKVGMKSEYWR